MYNFELDVLKSAIPKKVRLLQVGDEFVVLVEDIPPFPESPCNSSDI